MKALLKKQNIVLFAGVLVALFIAFALASFLSHSPLADLGGARDFPTLDLINLNKVFQFIFQK